MGGEWVGGEGEKVGMGVEEFEVGVGEMVVEVYGVGWCGLMVGE